MQPAPRSLNRTRTVHPAASTQGGQTDKRKKKSLVTAEPPLLASGPWAPICETTEHVVAVRAGRGWGRPTHPSQPLRVADPSGLQHDRIDEVPSSS
jgi:hypothetical protein